MCCWYTEGTTFDPTDPVVYLNESQCWCQCYHFTQSGLIQSHSRWGGPGWRLVCLNQPGSAWGHQNLPGERDKHGRLEGEARNSDDRLLVITCKHLLTLASWFTAWVAQRSGPRREPGEAHLQPEGQESAEGLLHTPSTHCQQPRLWLGWDLPQSARTKQHVSLGA